MSKEPVKHIPNIKSKEDEYLARKEAWECFKADNYEDLDDTELTLNRIIKCLKHKNHLKMKKEVQK